MPRIPEALIESIKRDVGCVAVLEARGVEFTAHGGGGDVVCRCPFHEDQKNARTHTFLFLFAVRKFPAL